MSLKRLSAYRFSELVHKVPRRIERALKTRYRRHHAHRKGAFIHTPLPGELASYCTNLNLHLSADLQTSLCALANLYSNGFFDLLGSGWTHVVHGLSPMGCEGHRYEQAPSRQADPEGLWLTPHTHPANLKRAQEIWQHVAPDYIPIDWQCDFRSGYRWEERHWFEQPFGHLPGVEVKVCWELSRMQHLPVLALAYHCTQEDRYAQAFRNQTLDFIATNPPGFGINYVNAMDVGIRCANMLIAYDLFAAAGMDGDPDFKTILTTSLYEQGRFILDHLEWGDLGERNNHYLANIVGLLFIAAYLPASAETDTWLSFAYRELLREVQWQFNTDGSCFEGTTCYHALSAEMVVWATALLYAVPASRWHTPDPSRWLPRTAALRAGKHYPKDLRHAAEDEALFPHWYLTRLARMHQFLRDITRPDGHLIQIGDNDSGRFLKLSPIVTAHTVAEVRARYANLDAYTGLPDTATYWDEDLLNYGGVTAALAPFSADAAPNDRVEAQLIQHFLHKRMVPASPAPSAPMLATNDALQAYQQRIADLPDHQKQRQVFPFSEVPHTTPVVYPDFGLYLYRSETFFLSIRCGPSATHGPLGHQHMDQLSVILYADDTCWLDDPGTYVYTALPARRNQYRAAAAHGIPRCIETPDLAPSTPPFALPGWAPAHCEVFCSSGMVGMIRHGAFTLYRMVLMEEEAVSITDFTFDAGCFLLDRNTIAVQQAAVRHTVGYGKVLHP